MRTAVTPPTRTFTRYTLFPQTRQCRPNHCSITVLTGTQAMPVRRLRVAGLTLLWAGNPFRGNSNHCQVSLKKPDGLSPKDDMEMSWEFSACKRGCEETQRATHVDSSWFVGTSHERSKHLSQNGFHASSNCGTSIFTNVETLLFITCNILCRRLSIGQLGSPSRRKMEVNCQGTERGKGAIDVSWIAPTKCSVYSLHIYILLLLHVSLYHTPSSGRTHVPSLTNTCCCCWVIVQGCW
jgi:hypothetical protein